MTPLDLRGVRELCEKATPGPWTANHGSWNSNVSYGAIGLVVDSAAKANADFIAASRQLVPQLLALVEELQAANEELADIAEGKYRPTSTAPSGRIAELRAIGQRAEGGGK